MREKPSAHQPHLLSSVDTLALWRCNEAGAVAFVDAVGAYTTTLGTLPPVAGGLFDSPEGATGSRDFNGSTHFATAPGDAAADAVLYPSAAGAGYTVEAWIRTDTNVEQTIVAYGGQSEISTGNTAFSFRYNNRKLKVMWEQGAGVDVVTETTGSVVSSNRVYHVALVVRRMASTCDVEFYVDGELAERFMGVTPATGGGVGRLFALGRHQHSGEATLFFDGRIDDVRISKFAASAAAIRDSYARGVRRFDVATMLASGCYETHLFVYAEWTQQTNPALIDRGIGYADLGSVFGHDHILGVEGGEDVDDVGQQATVRLRRNTFKQSLAPGMTWAALNDSGFLGVARRIKIEVAVVPDGYGRSAAAIYRMPIHEGFIGSVEWPGDEIRLVCPDRIGFLARTWIEENGTTDHQFGGAVSIESTIQSMLTTLMPAGGYKVDDDDDGAGAFTLYTPTSPAFTMNAFATPATCSVLSKIEEVAQCAQARVRMKWDDHRKSWRLTLYRPNRAATWSAGQPTFSSNETLDVTALELNDADIRNVCDVEYGDTATLDNMLQPSRLKQPASNAGSITAYGRRYCKIGIASNNAINTAAEAGNLATAVVSDLADPKAQEVREYLYRPEVELEDMVRLTTDGLTWSTTQDRATTGLQWEITADKARTRLSLRNTKPSGGTRRWFDAGVISRGFRPGSGKAAPAAPAAPTVVALAGALDIEWAPPVGKMNKKYRETEVHVSTSTGFTPTSATRKAVKGGGKAHVHDLLANTQYFVKLLHRDQMNNVSAASAQTAQTPRYSPKVPSVKGSWSADVAIPGSGKVDLVGTTFGPNVEANDHFGSFDQTASATRGIFTAPKDGLYVAAASLRITNGAARSLQVGVDWYRAGTLLRTLLGPTAGAGTDITATHGDVFWLAAGDTLRMTMAPSGSATLKTHANSVFAVSYLPAGGE